MAVHGDQIKHELYVAARPDVVFAMFIDPDMYIRWMGRAAELDPTTGGKYRCVVHDSATILGEYVIVDPPHRVDFTWGFEGHPNNPPGSSLVSVTLTPDGDGTSLTLIHTGLGHPALESHDRTWTGYVQAIRSAAENQA